MSDEVIFSYSLDNGENWTPVTTTSKDTVFRYEEPQRSLSDVMPYRNVSTEVLYQSVVSANWDFATKDDLLLKAKAHVEAENTFEVWGVIQKWFEMIEDGTAELMYPDPLWNDNDRPDFKPLTQELADTLIEEVDADFEMERARFRDRGGPDFFRLLPHSRLAFAQNICRVALSEKQMEALATKIVEGEESTNEPT